LWRKFKIAISPAITEIRRRVASLGGDPDQPLLVTLHGLVNL
jgi:hypothetical protein